MRKRSKILIILGVVAAALITAIVVLACTAHIYDPNKQLKKHAVEITAGEENKAKFDSSLETVEVIAGTASFRFTPAESAEYTFKGEDTSGGKTFFMDMYVIDESLSELLTADNYGGDSGSPVAADVMEGNVFLTKGKVYFAVVDVYSEEVKDIDSIESAFRFSVSRAGDGAPEELKTLVI